MGVFATRSPNRPNPLGLSSVKLESVEFTENGPELIVSGVDMMSGTGIFDIKPYQPGADAHPDTSGGFTDRVKWREIQVSFPEDLLARLPESQRQAAIGVLHQDPRPAYHKDGEHDYGMSFGGFDIRFTVEDGVLVVTDVVKM